MRALTAAGQKNGTIVYVPAGQYVLSQPLVCNDNKKKKNKINEVITKMLSYSSPRVKISNVICKAVETKEWIMRVKANKKKKQ